MCERDPEAEFAHATGAEENLEIMHMHVTGVRDLDFME